MALSKFLDPKLNLTFKKIFGTEKNKNILIYFLNDILGFTGVYTIQEVEFFTIMDPEIASINEALLTFFARILTEIDISQRCISLEIKALKNVLNFTLLKLTRGN